MTVAALLASVACETAGNLFLAKAGPVRRLDRWVVAMSACYVLSVVLLWWALSGRVAVGVVYGAWAALSVGLTAVAARVFFKDPLTPRMIAGLALIALGVVLVDLGGARA